MVGRRGSVRRMPSRPAATGGLAQHARPLSTCPNAGVSGRGGRSRDPGRAIGGVASFGPTGDHPHAVTGGGVYPLHDEEDRHVLEAAVAGEADLLVTANMADFGTADILKVGDGARTRLYPRPGRATLVIAHPDQARDWLQSGIALLPAIEQL